MNPPHLTLALDATVQAATVTALGTIIVALVGIALELLRRNHKRLGTVRDQVQNNHDTNLRDDVDQVLTGLDDVKNMLHQHGRDIGGIREELRHERAERLDVERRLTDHLRDS
ncbi:DUF2746 domain-containing protein [Actinoplanes sp. NPDC049548]|uniref:DUF2746 domain-containing protein n=1 Tax=Actinoplanes sp. NPDC049548 TaxID=3155152 RepID=UPI003441CDE9